VVSGRLINLGRQNYATQRAAAAISSRLEQLRTIYNAELYDAYGTRLASGGAWHNTSRIVFGSMRELTSVWVMVDTQRNFTPIQN
jgi:hypothetical protein